MTHPIPEAVFLADRAVVMSPPPRTLEARASADFGRLALEIYDLFIARPA